MDKLNAALDWLLPLNVNWFWLLIIASLLLAVVAWVWTCSKYSASVQIEEGTFGKSGTYKTVTYPFRTFLRSVVSVMVTSLAIFFIGWCIYANNRPAEVESEERLEIKPVTYPNGRVVQMFSCNGTNYNANTMFSSAPPTGSYVRRLIYKRVYVGVYFPPADSPQSRFRDTFVLVTPDKQERPAQNVTPDNEP